MPQSQPVASASLLVQRMSVRYDGLEDRIAMDVASAQGQLARLWLTRFGTDRLVSMTAARVESYAAAQCAQNKLAPAQTEQLCQSVLATQQLTARLTHRGATPVQLPPGTAEFLVTGFAMPPQQPQIRLDLRCRPALDVRLLLQPAEFFQWLGAVRRQYLRAAWPMDAWPEWLR